MKRVLVLATRNPGKAEELAAGLEGLGLTLQSLLDYPHLPPPPETGKTLEENARQKALYACAQIGLPALADDSGLEVDALEGAPGVYSARFAGESATAEDNIRRLLETLQGIPWEKRRACFRCVLVLALPEGQTYQVEGVCRGRIGWEPRGDAGFGYDPIFLPEGYTQTFAELGPSVKQQLSHRGRALQQLRRLLFDILISV